MNCPSRLCSTSSALASNLQNSISWRRISVNEVCNIMSAWAVDREFVNIDWASLGPNFTRFGSNLIQIESNSDHIGSHWPLLGQKWGLVILESKL